METRKKLPPAPQKTRTGKFGKSQEPQSLLPMKFVTRMVHDLFDQGLEYKITLGGRKSQEDSGAESPGRDDKRGVNV